MIKWNSPNAIAGFALVLFTYILFFWIIRAGIGGDTTTGVIVGHVAAWVEMFILFLFRKKTADDK